MPGTWQRSSRNWKLTCERSTANTRAARKWRSTWRKCHTPPSCGICRQRYGDGPGYPLAWRELPDPVSISLRPPGSVPAGRAGSASLPPPPALRFLPCSKEWLHRSAQFIIATHSPILMAFPDAVILSFDTSPVQPVRYQDLEHVRLTRDFLNNPDAFLKHL